ncbi:hypothetical protein [Marinoscillum pacificum]|uniref:hypothetical protein n=1 Tax=Marinoscillum pacificum TaxID=392723 RepID=UPI0021581186|nr:hypothetical protein [Marinoscillum pacificum]
MTRLTVVFFALVGIVAMSCEDDFGKKTVTYTKASAIYGDLDELRATPLVGLPREITDPGKIFVHDNLILVGEEGYGIHIIDNSDPQNPVPKSFLNIPGNREYFVSDGYLYAESIYDMLKVDISNVADPIIESRVNNAFLETIYANDGRAIIGFEYKEITEELSLDDPVFTYDTHDNVYYYDIDNALIPPSSVPASFAGNSSNGIGSVNRIIEYDDHVYAVSRGNLNIFTTDVGFEQVFSQNMGSNMETVFPMGDRLFIGTSNSVDIYDISDREQPMWLTAYWHMTSCDPVLPVNETTAYVTLRTGEFSECPGDENELLVIDIESNEFVTEIQEIIMDSPFGMTLIGDDLYVGEGESGLKVFDASDRRSLVLKETINDFSAYDVMAHPNRSDILLIATPDGLVQYQLDNNFDLLLISNIRF